MAKSPEAFRTISEVADWLGVPTHVLRFWESRFSQIKPVKRAGGRRYYRPNDMLLIGGIKRLLHDDGMTIRGAQKLIREKGVKYIVGLSQPLDGNAVPDASLIEGEAVEVVAHPGEAEETTEEQSANKGVIAFSEGELTDAEPASEIEPVEEAEAIEVPVQSAPDEDATVTPLIDASGSSSSIPATPDVPEDDAEDDDVKFPATPGLAARLRTADKAYLMRNRDAVMLLKSRLEARADA